jgi:hypothetical protein
MDILIRVLVYEPAKDGEAREIPDTVEALQAVVGGCFEVVRDGVSQIHMFVNDDADHLPVNRCFGQQVVRGIAVFSRSDDKGRNLGVSDADVVLLRGLYG